MSDFWFNFLVALGYIVVGLGMFGGFMGAFMSYVEGGVRRHGPIYAVVCAVSIAFFVAMLSTGVNLR